MVKAALEVVVVWMATCSRMVVGYVRDCVGDARTVCASSSRESLPGPLLIISTHYAQDSVPVPPLGLSDALVLSEQA